MYEVVILYLFVFSQEEYNWNVEGCKSYHFEVDSLPEYTEYHQEDDDKVKGMFIFFGYWNIVIAERVDQKYPLLQKLRDCCCIPPVRVEVPWFQLGYLGHSQHDILHYEII